MFGILHEDGSVERVLLDTSRDCWIECKEEGRESLNVTELVSELESLGGDSLNFEEVLLRHMEVNDSSDRARELVANALEHAHAQEDR